VAELAERVRAGERRALARAITLVESSRADHRAEAELLLESVLPHAGGAIRVGLSGAPGVGKSSFIEAFGTHLTGQGHKVAVLAVDPSSSRSGGSILGDKTRMEVLARDPDAFIRPSPAGRTLGGVARRTREAMLLVEAAGFDVVLVETVGVGQSEIAVADMVDMFVLLQSPGGGDELQGIKRGIMELADLVLVTKADGALEAPAARAAGDYKAALRFLRPRSPHWVPKVILTSVLTGRGIAEAWAAVQEYRRALTATGALDAQRAAQTRAWMWTEIREGLVAALDADAAVRVRLQDIEGRVDTGRLTPAAAAREVLALFRRSGVDD
jgi:LAO/AO transport system kinase